MKFSTADKCFFWLSSNIFVIFFIQRSCYWQCCFLAQWSSCWSELLIQNHSLCTWFTSVCLYLEKITFFKRCSSSVSWIFFFFFGYTVAVHWFISLFSVTSFPFYFPTPVKLSDTFIFFPVIKACCKQIKGWNLAFAPGDAEGEGCCFLWIWKAK